MLACHSHNNQPSATGCSGLNIWCVSLPGRVLTEEQPFKLLSCSHGETSLQWHCVFSTVTLLHSALTHPVTHTHTHTLTPVGGCCQAQWQQLWGLTPGWSTTGNELIKVLSPPFLASCVGSNSLWLSSFPLALICLLIIRIYTRIKHQLMFQQHSHAAEYLLVVSHGPFLHICWV